MTHRPVVVHTDLSPTGRRALRWAAAAVDRKRTTLHVVVAEEPAQPDPTTRRRGLVLDALAAVRAAVSGLLVPGLPSPGPAPDALRMLSTDAATLVVPATVPDVAAVVAQSYCPVVVVPRHAPPSEAELGPVVLAVAPWTAEHVIELAFEEASAQHAPLLAVRAWTDPAVDLGLLRSDRPAEWDRADQRAHRELELMLSPWRVVHPDVSVRSIAVQDGAADFLVALSHRARLVVLGRSTRGALLGGIAQSPVTALLRAARCPVLVVPAEGPPITSWLPGRDHGWALTAR